MPIRTAESPFARRAVAGDAQRVAEHASAIVKLEVELARLELKQKLTSLGLAIGLAGGAAICGLLMFGFLVATVAAALATFLSVWLALLVVTLFLLVLCGCFAALARRLIKRATPPVPEQTIREAKLTQAALEQ